MPGTDRSYSTMALWRVFRPYLLPHRARIAGAVVSLLMVAGALLTMGRGLAYLVDEGLGRQDPALLDRAVVGTAAIALLLAAGSYLRTTLVNQIGERVLDRGAQAGIEIGLAPAFLRGDGDFLGHPAEELAALGVDARFHVLDLGPFIMTGHDLLK